MDDIEHDNTTTEDVAETSIKKRPRKKHIYRQILQQMEFYFSNANLSRDRFLSQLLEQNKNVPLEVFLRFNKIRALTENIEEIAKALGSSQLLKLTDDGKCVYRSSAVQIKENQDDCIIYVEQLPPDANHDWVIGIFSAYGKVEYVSIPKYRNKATIKGFAFVEFDTPEAAKKALEAFGSAGCCLPPQMNPEELCSIATFEADDSEEHNENNKGESDMPEKRLKKKNKMNSEDIREREDGFEHEKEVAENEEPKSKKLKIEVDEHQEGEISRKKKKKKDLLNSDDNQPEHLENNVLESENTESGKTKKNKKRKHETENAEYLSEGKYCNREASSDDVSNKKKKKKNLEVIDEGKEETGESEVSTMVKNKKKKHQVEDGTKEAKRNPEEMEDELEDCNDLQQPKKSKKKKRCEVENDADKEVEDADDEGTSEKIQKQTEEEVGDDEENNFCDETGTVLEKSDKKQRARKRTKNKKKNLDKKENDPASLGLRIISKDEWRRLRNKYLNLQREKMQGLKKHLARVKFGSSYQSPYPPHHAKEKRHQIIQEDPKEKKTKYMPGVIIHMELAEPLGDVNGFKTEAKSHPGVVYVDATEGSSEVHIRCDSAEVAQKLIGTKPWDSMQILEGKAEKKYWEKVWTDREYKKKNKVRVNVRGRDKLLKRAERELGKHIKFDD
ncbi:hypothetical protein R5R35_007916 [Gryllus longicercus]|uniref:La-related protein 7 n=1 Tax=Gryllus longicercus TaxID=2509291 RepID=A0AAN9VAA5_9ORTH